jgi:hypothetical protein
LTADTSEVRAHCFSKFPKRDDPVLLTDYSTMFRYECKYNKPCRYLWRDKNYREVGSFHFNPILRDPFFVFDQSLRDTINSHQNDVKNNIEGLIILAKLIGEFFPTIRDVHSGSSWKEMSKFVEEINMLNGKVREIYASTKLSDFPDPNIIDKTWACFRIVQNWLIFIFDYIRKFGYAKLIQDLPIKVDENDYLDIEYCIVGSLVGAIATRDKRLIERYKLITPTGFVISD